jgi:hypothetical protein
MGFIQATLFDDFSNVIDVLHKVPIGTWVESLSDAVSAQVFNVC